MEPGVPDPALIIAISSRALFDLDESNAIYEEQGLEAYRRYQISHEDEALEPGEAYPFVRKLLHINKMLDIPKVEVILLSRNSADTGLRIFNSIKAHDLEITRAAFCGGERPYRYVKAFGVDLFLSTHPDDVASALGHGVAAATLIASRPPGNLSDDLRIAFDGDSVLFSDEADRVYRTRGLDAFAENEAKAASRPLGGGPFKNFLAGLHQLQNEFSERHCPIRTALVTARSAPAHERVIRTLRAWDVRLDECLFLGGADKTEFLKAFGADVFFDDQPVNIQRALGHVAAGLVPDRRDPDGRDPDTTVPEKV